MELIRDNWTKNDYDDFVEELRSYADEKYRSFHSSLIPDNDKDFFIGVRTVSYTHLTLPTNSRV